MNKPALSGDASADLNDRLVGETRQPTEAKRTPVTAMIAPTAMSMVIPTALNLLGALGDATKTLHKLSMPIFVPDIPARSHADEWPAESPGDEEVKSHESPMNAK